MRLRPSSSLLLLSLPLSLLACTGKEEAENKPPTCAITSPQDGAVYLSGAEVPLEAEIVDPEGQYVSVYWTSTASGPIADGATTSAVLPDGSQIITVQGLDDHGDTCDASVTVSVDVAPTLAVLFPLDGQVVASSTAVGLSASVTDVDDDAGDIVVSWSDSVAGDLGSASPGSDGTATVVTELSPAGAHTLTATATDPAGATMSVSVDVVVDAPPEAPVVTITPTDPGADDELVASVTTESYDPEGDPVTYSWLWYADGVLSSWSTTDTLSATATTRGQVWTARAVPNDGVMDGVAGEASATIVNTPPQLVSVSITPDPLQTDDTAQAVVEVYDADGDEVSYVWTWGVNGREVFTGRDTLSGLNFRRDQVVRVTVTPSDAEASGEPVSAQLTVVNTPPVPPTIEATPWAIEELQDIVCAVTVEPDDGDTDAVALTFSWTVDGVAFTDTTTTVYDGDTIPAAATVAGETWTCSVLSNDGYEDGAVVTSSTTVRTCAGGDVSCPVADCQAALDGGGSGGDGLYWLDLDGIVDEAWCDMTTDGGGWTLAERSSDDGVDTFTWDGRTSVDGTGSADGTADYRGDSYAGLGMVELMAMHAPSGTWAAYAVGDGSPLGMYLDDPATTAWPMAAGTLAAASTLCSTDLYLSVSDSTSGHDSFGPTWDVDSGAGCRTLPGLYGGIGPDGDDPAAEAGARGFAEALGLNTGTAGAGENAVSIYVR